MLRTSTVYAPFTATKGETFVWYSPSSRLHLGVAYLWKQGAFRALGNYALNQESEKIPLFRVGLGMQGIATGNPGYFATAEKNFKNNVNAYVGIGFRSNESHGHGLWGIKKTWNSRYTLGIQDDGHQRHPFFTVGLGAQSVGVYLIGGERPALMWSWGR